MWKYEIITQQIQWEKKFYLRSQLYARAYVRIWTLRPWFIIGHQYGNTLK